MKKILKKIFVYTAVVVITIIGASVAATFLYKDQLIDHFIREANKTINTPIHVGKIEVSALTNFPNVSLTFRDVLIEESYSNSSSAMLDASGIDFTFNPFNLLKGKYIIEEIHLNNAKAHLKVNEKGEVNYNIVKKTGAGDTAKVTFDLSKVYLNQVEFRYSNARTEVYMNISTPKAEARLNVARDIYDIRTSGDFNFDRLLVQNKVWVEEKDIALTAKVVYNNIEKGIDFNSSRFNVAGSDFIVYGGYQFKEHPMIDLNLEGENTTIQTILSLLPGETSQRFAHYRSSGEVYFDMVMKGRIDNQHSPVLDINFGLIDSDLTYPEQDVTISRARTRGKFHADDLSKASSYYLEMKNISGLLEGRPFSGNLMYKDFNAPHVKMDFEGDLDINSVFKFYSPENILQAAGNLALNVSFTGYLSDLKRKSATSRVKTSGDIDLKNVSLALKEVRLPLTALNGNLLFNDNDLALSNVGGKFGNTDFLLNGFFKNIIAYVLFENEPVGIESTLKSDFVDMDQLLSVSESDQENSDYVFGLSPRLRLKFNCDVKSLKFRRFLARNISGDLKIKDEVALTDQLSFSSMGGKVHMAGLVDAKNSKDIKVNTSFRVAGVHLDSAFYVLENFNQDFLRDRHLKGRVNAEVKATMDFNEKLTLFSETLMANVSASIIGGELNNFEPMQRLARYVDAEKLDHLTFSEIKNDFFIQDKTIYLPQMEIQSNVTQLRIGGTHTFNQKIDYRVIAPLRSTRKVDKDEAFGAIEEDGNGRSLLYLKIVGTAADYRIVYDKDAVKQKIASDLKKEVKELKEAFKNKGLKKQETIELEEDDYFDWEPDGKQ
ncbi:DUF3971 domain-containing protein [Fulvivirga sp. M361]|uniref:DUF3971 domain-containing protein n=1 Tax=Fulvivirga sp. M361 TaxID=2594266 RepID=UPI00117BD2E8|nr:DUF3971 domain-containing protein [Fulvivirga sp. M361]TRX58803.1 DUF3971 domain-containing protein [Fulvivirga sp. M361]